MSREAPYANIDIHNNTGNNPHYACITSLNDRYLHLARLFSRTIVHFKKPVGVQAAALAAICPAVTIECGPLCSFPDRLGVGRVVLLRLTNGLT